VADWVDNWDTTWNHLQHILKGLKLAVQVIGCDKCEADFNKMVAGCRLCGTIASSEDV
jgi:hypothetical protein